MAEGGPRGLDEDHAGVALSHTQAGHDSRLALCQGTLGAAPGIAPLAEPAEPTEPVETLRL